MSIRGGEIADTQLKKTLATMLGYGESVGVLYIEIDEPTRFNDMIGKEVDILIREKFTRLLFDVFREVIFARRGEAHFIVVLPSVSLTDLSMYARRIVNAVREPMTIEEHLFYLTISVGTAYADDAKDTVTSLLERAKEGMISARKRGYNKIVHIARREKAFTYEQELQLLKDIPRAIENGDIYFVYQLQYSYATERFCGAEMLARWKHPDFGNISPHIFIPLAEKTGMIMPMATRSMIEAARFLKKTKATSVNAFKVSINMPFQVLMEESFIETILFVKEAYEIDDGTITFEIMEETIPDHLESFAKRLREIKKLGFSLAVDDYGTGHTSLTYLLHFPIDYLKIDRSFIREIHRNRRNYLLFRSIVDMANALSLSVVVEGVENEEEDEVLRNFGELSVQGYLYSRPSREETVLSSL